MTLATAAPEPQGVLTADFPGAGEMLSWFYGHVWSWVSARPALTALGLVGLVVFYVVWVFRRAVVAV